MKILTFVAMTVLALANAIGLSRDAQAIFSDISETNTQPEQKSGVFCSNGFIYEDSGEQVRFANGAAVSFGNNNTCARSIGRRE